MARTSLTKFALYLTFSGTFLAGCGGQVAGPTTDGGTEAGADAVTDVGPATCASVCARIAAACSGYNVAECNKGCGESASMFAPGSTCGAAFAAVRDCLSAATDITCKPSSTEPTSPTCEATLNTFKKCVSTPSPGDPPTPTPDTPVPPPG